MHKKGLSTNTCFNKDEPQNKQGERSQTHNRSPTALFHLFGISRTGNSTET